MILNTPATREKLYNFILSYECRYHKNSKRKNLIWKNKKDTFIFYLCTVWSLECHSTNPKPLSGSPPSASEITASQPWSRDAVCLVIWWLIPCLFPTNLFPDKGVASTLVNMGDLAALADCQTRGMVKGRGRREITGCPFLVNRTGPLHLVL